MNITNKASFCKLYFKINFTKKNPVNNTCIYDLTFNIKVPIIVVYAIVKYGNM